MTKPSRSTSLSNHERSGEGTRKKQAGVRILLGILAFAVLPVIAVAEETTCKGKLGGTTVDNLRVPDGTTCTLNRTHVKGTIKVESGAALYARGVRVVGNVQAENARLVSVTESSRIGGNVQVKQGGSATVLNSVVQGTSSTRPITTL